MGAKKTMLLVDDSENDLLLMQLAFQKAEFNADVQVVKDGEEAIAYLQGDSPYNDRVRYPMPTLVLLDLNMPKKTGFEVLSWMRAQPGIRRLPVIILTASMRSGDVEQAFDLNANFFLVKPARVEDLISMMRCLRDWLGYNHFPTLCGVQPRLQPGEPCELGGEEVGELHRVAMRGLE